MQKSRQNERKICARVRDRHRKLGSPALTKLLWQVWKYIVSTDIIALDSFYCQAPRKSRHSLRPSMWHLTCRTHTTQHISISFLRNNPENRKGWKSKSASKKRQCRRTLRIRKDFSSFFFYVCLPDLIDEYSAGCDKCGGGGDPRNNLNRISICVH